MGQLPRPLSNEELQALRDKAAVKPATKPATAFEIAYDSGIKALGPVVARIEALEAQVKDWTEKLRNINAEKEERIQRLEKTIAAILESQKPAAVSAAPAAKVTHV